MMTEQPGWLASSITSHTASLTYACRDNLEDALQKLQEILDAAWKAVQPIEEDPEKKKKLEKQ